MKSLSPSRAGQLPARPLSLALALALTGLLHGCAATPPSSASMAAVQQLTQDRIGASPADRRNAEAAAQADAQVRALLKQPLTADSAVAIALLNNPGLQAQLAELGLADAELAQIGQLANPSLRWGRLAGGGQLELDRAIVFDVLGWLSWPLARQVEQQRLVQAQMQAADEAVHLATEARLAFFDAVAAQQLLGYFGQVHEAAEAASELAHAMQQAGNLSQLARMREQAFQADSRAQLARVRQQAVAARERLARVLAVADGPEAITLPERLPDLPAQPLPASAAEHSAIERRLDVLQARQATAATAQALGLSRSTRFINVLQAGYQTQSSRGEPRRQGYEIELQLPLFDFGDSRHARAEAIYMQAVARTAQVANQARSEVRESYAAYRAAYAQAQLYRDEIVPLRQRISDEQLLRYNGMLASVFELLADSREQIASVSAAVEALRDHWLAQTRLQAAIGGHAPTEAGPSAERSTDTTDAAPSRHAH